MKAEVKELEDILAGTYGELCNYLNKKTGSVVLLLGPELSVSSNGVNYRTYFKSLLANLPHHGNKVTRYFETENLFSFADDLDFRRIRREVVDFYSTSGDSVLLELIARIKFPLIINVCPDMALNEIFDARGVLYKDGYFSESSKAQFENLPLPNKELPVIYNIFGRIDKDQTLLLRHSDIYRLMEMLLPQGSLPTQIESYLNEASSFIFLGFKFDSWYYQLICHKLKVKTGELVKVNLGAPGTDVNNVSGGIIMQDHFNICFTAQNPTQVVQRILAGCDANTVRPKTPLGRFSTFISYSRRPQDAGPGSAHAKIGDLANVVATAIRERDASNLYQVFIDETDLAYGESIDSFMNRIGKGKTVIRVISDKYIRSIYCMTEARRIYQYKDAEKRVFTLMIENLKPQSEYQEYWRNEIAELASGRKGGYDDIKLSIDILQFLDDFFAELRDVLSLRLAPEQLLENNGVTAIHPDKQQFFDKFIDDIIKKMNEDE